MSKSHIDEDHYRVTFDDGKTSRVYEKGGLFGPDKCIEVADHHADGTTTAYKYDGSLLGSLLDGGRGKKNNPLKK